MDKFATPWHPKLNGNDLGICSLIQDLEEYGIVPNPHVKSEASWSAKGLRKELEKAPEAMEALQESAHALWRLKEAMEDGQYDDDWKSHVTAWLVRHRELCTAANVPLLKVVDDWSYVLVVMGIIPSKSFAAQPAFLWRGPTPQSSSDAAKDLTPRAKRGIAAEANEDVRMDDVDDVPNERRSEVGAFERKLQESPSKNQPSTERSPLAITGTTVEWRFGGHEVEEDVAIDPNLFPVVKGAICDLCSSKGKDDCFPCWSLRNTKTVIRCLNCLNAKLGCSFVHREWGVIDWPTVLKTSKGENRRAMLREEKKRSNRKKQTQDTLAITTATSEESTTGGPLTRAKILRANAGATKPTSTPPGTTRECVPPKITTTGHKEQVMYEDLAQYENILLSPSRSVVTLRSGITQLQSARIREKGMLDAITAVVHSRRQAIDGLIMRMEEDSRKEGDWKGRE